MYTEKEFQSQVVQLAKICGWKVYHTYDSRRSEPGMLDLILVKNRVLWRELKTATGKITPAQRDWLAALEAAGQDARVWRPEDFNSIQEELMR